MAEGKWIVGVAADAPVAEAARAVLVARFAAVSHFLPLALEKPYEDAEHVHQLRVATRRAGAALRVFADALPRKSQKAVRNTLRELRRAAGDARDWDVFLASLPAAKTLHTTAAKPARDFLTGYAFGQRAAAQTRLSQVATILGPVFDEQSADLPGRARAPEDDPTATFRTLAARQLGELFRIFNTDLQANPTEPSQLHALRIAAKRLRYAIEIFAECFAPQLKETIYPAAEAVQEILGSVQDATVAAEHLAVVRQMVQAVQPAQATRIRKGLDSFAASLRAKIPAGKKAFATWRRQWLEAMKSLTLEVVVATA